MEYSIEQIKIMYREKKINTVELVTEYIKQIKAIDIGENGLHSIAELNMEALTIARRLDIEREKGLAKGLLHGIPITIKGNINTKDKMSTTTGSLALENLYADYDATIVTKLREEGALILAKANMTEFANAMSKCMPAGYSSRGGQVKNPYNKEETPMGSSAGSAVNVAANLCVASVGTETLGSIMAPAWYNGVVGMKPTMGRISRHGIIPISNALDTPGSMAKCVEDVYTVYQAIAGYDSNDVATALYKETKSVGSIESLQNYPIKGLRIGVNRANADRVDKETAQANENVIKLLKALGAVVIDELDLGTHAGDHGITLMRYEFKPCINNYLSTLKHTSIRTLKDIITHNNKHHEKCLRYGQNLLIESEQASGNLLEEEYIEALLVREQLITQLDAIYSEQSLDILFSFAPTNSAPFTGFPCITIPIGQKSNNVPIGSYFMARRNEDEKLLAFANQLQKALNISLNKF